MNSPHSITDDEGGWGMTLLEAVTPERKLKLEP